VIEASFLEEELTQDQIKEKSEELEQTLSSLEQKEERWLELSMKLEG
jgi:ATP-binding cassette subfamily F protein uup